jgi:hypothetical protein
MKATKEHFDTSGRRKVRSSMDIELIARHCTVSGESVGMGRVPSHSLCAMPNGSTPILDHHTTSLPARCSLG